MQPVDRKVFLVSIKAVIAREGRILLVKKPGGVWDLPGGRLEDGESIAGCLARELYEETGLRAAPAGIAASWVRRREPRKPDVFVVAYWCEGPAAPDRIRLSEEHDDSGYFAADALHDPWHWRWLAGRAEPGATLTFYPWLRK